MKATARPTERLAMYSRIIVLLFLTLTLLDLLNHIAHKRASKQDRRLVQIMVLVAQRAYPARFEDQTRVIRDVPPYPSPCQRA